MRGLTALDQAIVDKQTKAIEEALENLEFKDADYSAYDDAVEKANALDKSLYTDTAELERLLSKNIRGLTILNQDIVDTQTQAILDAINALVYKPADLTEYYKAVEQAEAIDRSLYEDLTALDEVLKVDVSNKNITEQAEVDAQTRAILDAINGLVEKEVPTQPTTPTEPEVPTEPVEPTTPENIYGKRQRDFYSLSA